jgi:hypothetical protein
MTEGLAQHTTQRSGWGGCRNTLVNTSLAGRREAKNKVRKSASPHKTRHLKNLIASG